MKGVVHAQFELHRLGDKPKVHGQRKFLSVVRRHALNRLQETGEIDQDYKWVLMMTDAKTRKRKPIKTAMFTHRSASQRNKSLRGTGLQWNKVDSSYRVPA